MFLTIEYKHIDSYYLDRIVVAALEKRQVEFVKFVVAKGYIQAFDIIYEWGFDTSIEEGIFEVVEYFLANRISSLCGPVEDYPRVASPQYHVNTCIEKGHPDVLRLLLQNGYDQVKNVRLVYNSAFKHADPIYRQILLEYGFDFCTLENTRFVDSIEGSDFQAVKWMIEEAKCPHRETWVELKERAFEQGFEEIYYYLCEYLGETAVDPAIVKLTNSLLSESTEALVALVASGINIQALFPESSEMVKKVEMFEILKQSGCKVIPNIFIFCDALKINRLDSLEGMIESGLKIDSDLLQLFLDNYDTNRRVWSTRNIVDTFHKYGVKVTEYSKVWDLAFEEKNVKELDFLTRHSDTKRLFGNKYVLQRVFLKPDFDELTMLLLSMGYPIEAFDGLLFRILVGTCRVSLVVTIFKEHPTLDFYPFLPKVLALTHYEELQSNYFNVLVHPSKFTDQDVVDITKVILSKVAIPFFSKLESEGRSLDHQELLNVIAARNISPVEDTEFFEMFVEKYSDVDFDMQVPLLIAVTNGNDILVKYLTEHHPNKVEVSIAILSISRETENEFVMFVLQKYHQQKCELCSDLNPSFPFDDPAPMLDSILLKHDFEKLKI